MRADRHAIAGIDEAGVRVPRRFRGAADVEFNGRRVWSFSVESADETAVAWPRRLLRMLDGYADVRVLSGDRVLVADRVQFGEGTDEIDLRDSRGNPIIVDKWGLIQRPFESRDATVVDDLTAQAVEILEVMRRDCGFEGWISFGTLLGAARDGHAIGHDSDIDLCFLSTAETPAGMAADLWRIGRALREAGMRVEYRSASFLTVMFQAADGAAASIDVYTVFYLDGLLHETATVRAPVPREALMPLSAIEFEGRMLPAPADPAALLEVSYGPGWRVPDPSFQHRPGPEVVDRFKGWFGTLMHSRREWNHANALVARERQAPSEFARWVAGELEPGVRVVEVGVGGGADLRLYAESGHSAVGLDFVVPRPVRASVRGQRGASLVELNLDDRRAVLARGALLARSSRRLTLVAYRLFEALDPDGVEAFWVLARMAMRQGGRAYLGGESFSPRAARERSLGDTAGKLRSFAPSRLEDHVRRSGARVVSASGLERAERAARSGAPATWRMVVEWPQPTGEGDR